VPIIAVPSWLVNTIGGLLQVIEGKVSSSDFRDKRGRRRGFKSVCSKNSSEALPISESIPLPR
jgi:hypothetical protein